MDYTYIDPKNLRRLYVERANKLGVAKPYIPRTKKGLARALRATDLLGSSGSGHVNSRDPLQKLIIEILTEGMK